jgi:hypothetical protein
MGIFSRNSGKGNDDHGNWQESSGEPEEMDHQSMAIELIDGFTEHDEAGLDALDRRHRAEQVRIRFALYSYVDEIWEKAKNDGLNPATRPEWSAVAACVT